MTGIEKIIDKIEKDCNVNCDEIISKAQQKAQSILDDAQIKCEKAKAEETESAINKCRTEIELATSRAANERKKAVLATKIKIINEVIEEAMLKLKNVSESEYFDIIKTFVKKYSLDGQGILHFSKKDLDRIPKDFEKSLNEMLKGSKKSIIISNDTVNIENGVIVVYGDIEQNCTFESVLNASLDEIKDELYEEIFVRNKI